MSKTMPPPDKLYSNIQRDMKIGEEVIQSAIDYLESGLTEKREKKGHVLLSNYNNQIEDYYTLAQIEWRLNIRNPSVNMINSLKSACNIIESAAKYGIKISTDSNFRYTTLTAYIAIILSGKLPKWIEPFLEKENEFIKKKSRLTMDEIDENIESSLIYCITNSKISKGWKRIIKDFEGRKGKKLYYETQKAYGSLLEAINEQDEGKVLSSVETINKNYSKRIAYDFDPFY